jgi:hypothetical protein
MTGQVQEIANRIEKDLRELDGIRLGDVSQRLVDLEQELKCLSDVQRGIEVRRPFVKLAYLLIILYRVST